MSAQLIIQRPFWAEKCACRSYWHQSVASSYVRPRPERQPLEPLTSLALLTC